MDQNNTKWVAMFSRTGQELADIINHRGISPNVIIATIPFDDWCTDLKVVLSTNSGFSSCRFISKNLAKSSLTIQKALSIPPNNTIITLHGWLYLIPDDLCDLYEIYNGHPGDITLYPELKGMNPQQKAFDLKLPSSGSIVHRVIPEVDSGEIMTSATVQLKADDTTYPSLDEVYNKLRVTSLQAWIDFFDSRV